MIRRTYGCAECNYTMTVELRSEQWNQEPPSCPRCAEQTHQEFVPPAIGGSPLARSVKIAETIAAEDYGVADMKLDGRGGPNKVRFKDGGPGASTWGGVPQEALQQAVSLGRQTRLQHGSSLDVIKTMPDLIEASRRKSARIW